MDTATFKKYFMRTENFQWYCANPTSEGMKGYRWNKPDCVIRALSKAADIPWIEAYDYLSERARRDFTVPNDGTMFRKWILENGATWTHMKAEKGKKRMTAEEFAKTHKEGRYVISIANHETACVDGVIYDTWNCGCKCVVGFYDMTNFKI